LLLTLPDAPWTATVSVRAIANVTVTVFGPVKYTSQLLPPQLWSLHPDTIDPGAGVAVNASGWFR